MMVLKGRRNPCLAVCENFLSLGWLLDENVCGCQFQRGSSGTQQVL